MPLAIRPPERPLVAGPREQSGAERASLINSQEVQGTRM